MSDFHHKIKFTYKIAPVENVLNKQSSLMAHDFEKPSLKTMY